MPITRRDEPVEMVNIRLAAIGKRPKLKFPRKARRQACRRPRRRAVISAMPPSRSRARSMRANACGRIAHYGPGTDRRARDHDSNVRGDRAGSRRPAN